MKKFAMALALALSTCVPAMAPAHMSETGWHYPMDCCGEKDCRIMKTEPKRVVAGTEVMHVDGFLRKADEDGWLVHGWYVPDSKTRISPDEYSHECSRNQGEVIWYPDIHLTPGLLAQRGGLSSPGEICFWIGEKDIEKAGLTRQAYTNYVQVNVGIVNRTTDTSNVSVAGNTTNVSISLSVTNETNTTNMSDIDIHKEVIKNIEKHVHYYPIDENPDVTKVSLPAGFLLLGTALAALGFVRRRKRS